MACGCYPVAGDIEALREWITDGENGRLFDPHSHEALAQTMIEVIEDSERGAALKHNRKLVEERAEYGKVMERVEGFYKTQLM
jgi:glycosyltransferase involved in cell wall biosynthesis